MASVTHEIGTADTGATPNVSGSFTPAVGDLLIGFFVATATVAAAPTFVGSAGPTFTRFATAQKAAGGDRLYGFVANSLVVSAIAQTITADTPADAATGTIIYVAAVAGMTRTGLNAIRQSAVQNDQASGIPAPAFSVAALTQNACLGFVANATNPSTFTQPTGWTEGAADLGFATPTTGAEYCFRNSGFTGTTVTWGSNGGNTAFGAIIVELDTSSPPGGAPTRMIRSDAVHRRGRW